MLLIIKFCSEAESFTHNFNVSIISDTIPFYKQLGLILPSVPKVPEGGEEYTLLLCQKGLQMVAVFSYKFLFSFPVGVQCQDWPKEQCMWQKDTKGGGGERKGCW